MFSEGTTTAPWIWTVQLLCSETDLTLNFITSSVNLGKILNLSKTHFSLLHNEDNTLT